MPLRALIVAESRVIRMIHAAIFNRFGFVTATAENGAQAVHLFQAGNTYDIVVMGLKMPVMDGPMATRELRRMGVSSKIIGASGCNIEAETTAFIEAGLDRYLEMPFNLDAVEAMLLDLQLI